MADAVIPLKLKSFIDTRDRDSSKVFGFTKTPHSDNFSKLLAGSTVRIGGRASCGGRTDPSWTEFTAWNEIVRKAQGMGYDIEVVPVKHGNSWATKSGGFWNENDYRIRPSISMAAA